MGFRHVVLLQFSGASDDKIEEVVTALHALPAEIPELRSYIVGRDVGLASDNFDIGVVADFDDQDAYLVYRDHPAHQKVIAELITPIRTGRTAVQHAT